MTYTTISPATDWFFRHDAPPGSKFDPVFYHVAVWALTEEGKVVGLIAHDLDKQKHSLSITPPDEPGCYLHRDQLSADDLELIKKR